jgi:hypothetical protein
METKKEASIVKKTGEESRREFMIKAGKMALYIPPAMMVLMHPSRSALACGSINPPKCYPRDYKYPYKKPYDNKIFRKGGFGGFR